MDLALAINQLVPAATYGGSTNANTEEAFNTLRWEDVRTKPTWEEIESAWLEVNTPTGFHVTPEDFYLAVSVEDQNAFSRYVTTLMIKNPAPETPCPIKDSSGNVHTVTYARLKVVMSDYADSILASTFS